MKIRVTLMTENDKSLPEGVSKERMEAEARMGWQMLLNMFTSDEFNTNNDTAYVESCELVEE